MRPRHSQHPLPAFPVYSSAFLSEHQLVLGGGGGASRSGIQNKLRLYDVAEDRSIQLKVEFELERGEDAPMSMAAHADGGTVVCGVNSIEEKLQKGENENCRVFGLQNSKITSLNTKGTLPAGDLEDYQKVTVLSPDGTLVAVAGAHDLSLLSYHSLTSVAEPIHTEKEIYDATISQDSLVVATTHNLFVYELPTVGTLPSLVKGKSKRKTKTKSPNEKTSPLKFQRTIELPSSIVGEGSTFRAVRFHPTDSKIVYTVVNSNPPRSRQKKSASRQAYIIKWNAESWTVDKSRKIGDKGVTCFDISPDGRFLGFGSSELSIGMLDVVTLAPLVTILKAHEFPPTTIKFNPSTTLLVSGSADNSLRVVSVPQVVSNSGSGFLLFILAIITIIIALLAQFYLGSGSLW